MTTPLTPEVQTGTTRRGYLVALGVVVAGVAIGALGMWRTYNNVAAMPRVEARGTHVVDLPSGDLTVFAELGDGNAAASFTCAAQDAAGAPLKLEHGSTKVSYGLGEYHGESVFDLSVPSGGPVTITCETDADMKLAFGKGIGTSMIIGIVVPLLSLLVAGFVVVRTWLRRRWERQQARATAP